MFILPFGASQDGAILETLNPSFRFSHLSLPGGRLGRGEILGVSDPMNYLAPNEQEGSLGGKREHDPVASVQPAPCCTSGRDVVPGLS